MTMPSLETVHQLPKLKPRPADSNKGMFGRVLVVAGSRGMAGAAVLCGSAALRGGAGLVTLAVPEEILPQVAVANPCYLTASLPQDQDGRLSDLAEMPLRNLLQNNSVVAMGPGLGRSSAISALVSSVIAKGNRPLVLDADGLNAMGNQAPLPTLPPRVGEGWGGGRSEPLILTPHPGEFARLLGREVTAVQADRQGLAVQFAAEHGVVMVLKGHGTIVTDGRRVYHNRTGNPGMATGGTGDVLTGLIAALLGQGLEPFSAAQLGVFLHGLAGDLARDELGEASLIASDLLHFLPRALRNY
jgi:NAD(P)H-hydrate epimerase